MLPIVRRVKKVRRKLREKNSKKKSAKSAELHYCQIAMKALSNLRNSLQILRAFSCSNTGFLKLTKHKTQTKHKENSPALRFQCARTPRAITFAGFSVR
jgi:hypothetical protein